VDTGRGLVVFVAGDFPVCTGEARVASVERPEKLRFLEKERLGLRVECGSGSLETPGVVPPWAGPLVLAATAPLRQPGTQGLPC
jgi:hypothetical protein